jgi:Tol biopolymer transport system component
MFSSLGRLSSPRTTLLLGASLAFAAVVTSCSDSSSTDPTPVVATTQQPHTNPPNPPSPPLPPPPGIVDEHIYIANADGSAQRRVVAGSWPAWSPDGTRLSFTRGGSIYVINADGTNETRIANTGAWPSWSPDGKKFAFVKDDGINTMNADGTGVTLLLRRDFRDDTYAPWDMGPAKPVWSPNGKRIAFEHLGDGDLQPAQVFVINVDGSNLHRASIHPNGSYAESDPAWSPDGTKLAYWSYVFGIVITNADGGVPQGIYVDFPAVAYGAKPAWSLDGGSIAFNRNRLDVSLLREILIISTQDGSARPFLMNAFDLAYCPDGQHIAFVSTRTD